MKTHKPIKIRIHTITCKGCHEEIYSRARRDFRSCKCGMTHIDGGFDYMKCSFDPKTGYSQHVRYVPVTRGTLYTDWTEGTDKYGKIVRPPNKDTLPPKRPSRKDNMPDLRSPLAKARDEWFGTDLGKRCTTCISGTLAQQFLQNRLEVAFCAGWDACLDKMAKTTSTAAIKAVVKTAMKGV